MVQIIMCKIKINFYFVKIINFTGKTDKKQKELWGKKSLDPIKLIGNGYFME